MLLSVTMFNELVLKTQREKICNESEAEVKSYHSIVYLETKKHKIYHV